MNWDAAGTMKSKKDFDHLSPCHLENQYPHIDHVVSYNVIAFYCLIDAEGDVMPGCCDKYMRTINVSQY